MSRIGNIFHVLVSQLDAFRGPSSHALEPAKPLGALLRVATFLLWFGWTVVYTNSYIQKPNIIQTDVRPSATLTNNVVSFEMDNGVVAYAQSYQWGKYWVTDPCDLAASNTPLNESAPICPYAVGATPCGQDPAGANVLFPVGTAYYYAISDPSLIDNIYNYQSDSMFTITTSTGSTASNLWIDAWPVDQVPPAVSPTDLLIAQTTVIVDFQRNINIKGVESLDIVSTSTSVEWVVLDMNAKVAPLYNCGKGLYVDDIYTVGVDNTLLEGGLDPVNGSVPGYTGLGVIIFATTDTTIITTTVTGRDTILGFLALLGGAYGLLMTFSRVTYFIYTRVQRHRLHRPSGVRKAVQKLKNGGKSVFLPSGAVAPVESTHHDHNSGVSLKSPTSSSLRRHVAESGPVRPTTILEEPPYPGYHLQSAPHLQAPVDDVIAVGEDKAYAVNHHVTLQDVSQSSV